MLVQLTHRILAGLLIMLTLAPPSLTLECLEDDTDCLRRCRPGTIGEPQSRLVEQECPMPSRTKMESHLRCWIGKVPEHPKSLAAAEITNTSVLLAWSHSNKWPNVTRLHYECRLTMEKYLVDYFDHKHLSPLLGSVPTELKRSDGATVTNTQARVRGLRPGQSYNCFLWVEFNHLRGARSFVKFQTMPGAPAFPVGKLQLSYEISTDSISLRWSKIRPKSDPVTGYKLTLGNSVRTIDQSADRFDIGLIWWNQLIGESGLINVTIAPVNVRGTGPETKASVMPPPYDDYYLSNNGCKSQDKVYTFEDLAPIRDTSKVCYREVFFQECARKT